MNKTLSRLCECGAPLRNSAQNLCEVCEGLAGEEDGGDDTLLNGPVFPDPIPEVEHPPQ